MSRATSDDQLKFLLSCVRHSNNGKVDFVEVANECGVVSKGAAAKRYERLMKANGIHPSGNQVDTTPPKPSAPAKHKAKDSSDKAASTKKRKIEDTNPKGDANTNGNAKVSRKEHTSKPSTTHKTTELEAQSHGAPAPTTASMPMPTASSPFFPRPMHPYSFPHQGMRPSFPAYPPLSHSPAASLPPGMHIHAPYAVPLNTHMPGAIRDMDNRNGPDQYSIAPEAFIQPQAIHQNMMPAFAETLPTSLPPPPQEIEPLRQHGTTSSVSTQPKEEQQPVGHVVIDD
ncbi:hypothetical protein HRR83_005870 [Exophiala dermatitidis]|uniref:Myb-like DNA-binding domain-containing protein n=2 Tax=Exophiala dermatitidis TaxID=5970 RepID=H6BUJ6_EXODN|nr:uncharacterized protein HMPREF1120_03033 [Exophiala dermatitidis NIH/UT8656]KAJ4508778.1 hypothetical protein HRR73_007447 [Exophiala dermatitidis]EHY54871.1 hypothetical protein HMPREF1120_03033 [Exophiala dermatitidis NIH/UT8656]KAJ4511019.1 hypothetical protein HRR75_005715 [Exophiala dermatitidis]KAJ4513425.1 hypothetical protein HRR74_006239 [Exophiala dermatitidis]KAJ4538019.1 hypothetical protein HRR77_007061 [Exophiala dermatitidis]